MSGITQSDIDEAEKRALSGIAGTRHGDTSVNFQPIGDQLKAIDRAQSRIASGLRRVRYLFQSGKGL